MVTVLFILLRLLGMRLVLFKLICIAYSLHTSTFCTSKISMLCIANIDYGVNYLNDSLIKDIASYS